MRPEIRSMEGIVLRAGKGREGGRLVSVFTRKMGFLRLGVSRQALSATARGSCFLLLISGSPALSIRITVL